MAVHDDHDRLLSPPLPSPQARVKELGSTDPLPSQAISRIGSPAGVVTGAATGAAAVCLTKGLGVALTVGFTVALGTVLASIHRVNRGVYGRVNAKGAL